MYLTATMFANLFICPKIGLKQQKRHVAFAMLLEGSAVSDGIALFWFPQFRSVNKCTEIAQSLNCHQSILKKGLHATNLIKKLHKWNPHIVVWALQTLIKIY